MRSNQAFELTRLGTVPAHSVEQQRIVALALKYLQPITLRAHPLEAIALIDNGGEEEREVGNERLPDDVLGEAYNHLLDFDVDEYLSLGEEDRGTHLDVEPEVTRREIAELSSDQPEESITLIATGVGRRDALAEVMAVESESGA